MADWEIGYMFLNFILSEEVRPFCEVDVPNLHTKQEWYKNIPGGWEIWNRKIIALTGSPYHEFQAVTWSKRITLGYRQNLNDNFG